MSRSQNPFSVRDFPPSLDRRGGIQPWRPVRSGRVRKPDRRRGSGGRLILEHRHPDPTLAGDVDSTTPPHRPPPVGGGGGAPPASVRSGTMLGDQTPA